MSAEGRRSLARRFRLGAGRPRVRARGLVDEAVLGFLRSHPLFRDADPAAVARLAERARPVRLPAGDFLFHQDDPPTSVFVVEEGRLEILYERPGTEERLHVAELGRGAVVGEIGVMRGDARTASVRALTSAALLGIPGREFIAYARATPSAALRLAEILAERTRTVLVRETADLRRGEVWAVARAPDLDSRFAAALARATWTPGSGPPPTVWCADGARVALGKSHGLMFEPLGEPPRPQPGEVAVVLGAAEAVAELGAGALISDPDVPTPPGLSTDRHIRVRRAGPVSARVVRLAGSSYETAERIVRILEHRSIGLALGGGGALGLCHLGVLEVLIRERVPIDVIAGTSAGAMVGALYLVRGLAEALEIASGFPRSRLFTLVDPSFFLTGIIEGSRILKLFRQMYGDARIEELPIPFAAVALDLETGEERALTGGPLAEALRATTSLTSVFAPFTYPGEEGVVPGGTYVDAGAVNNVPVDVARELGASRVLAVNVINKPRGWSRAGPTWRRWSPIGRGKASAYAELLSFARNGERQAYTADLPILPDTHDFGFTQFYRAQELFEAGRAAAEDLMPQIRALVRPDAGVI